MKRGIALTIILFLTATSLFAQPKFHLGIKGGIHTSKIITNLKNYNSETIIKAHAGAFIRLGINHFYIQPEAYFIAKGSEMKSNRISDIIAAFDYNSVDVPILLGINLFQGGMANVRIMGGPVFNFVVSKNIKDELQRFDKQYFEDRYYGYQYGIGFDISSFSLDVRLENSIDPFYKKTTDLDDIKNKNKSLLVTLSYKIL